VKRNQPGLAKVVNWLQNNENGVGVEGTIPVPNLIQAMLERNEKLVADDQEPDELILVMVYNPASGLDNNLVKEAHENGIRVIDLCAAGDDIVPEDPEPPADEQPPFEPDPPGTENVPAEPAADAEPPKEESAVGKAVRKATTAGKAAAAKHPAPEPVVHTPAPGGPPLQLIINVPIDQPMIDALARAIVQAMGAQASAVVATTPLASVTELPVGDKGTNKDDPAGQPEGTAVYYYHAEEDKYRPARGTKRRGEERAYLTPAEVADVKAKGLMR
jgi:hypothetical protein